MGRVPLLDRYTRFVDKSQIESIYEVARSLAGLRVLHVNTTDVGGGVAELLHELLPLMKELGIQHDWKVILLDEASGYFTTKLADMLQGYDTGEMQEQEKDTFLEKLHASVKHESDYQADIYFIHDFQLAPLATFFPWMKPAIWFCHIDTAHPNPSAEQYIRQFLDAYALLCFNSQESIFKNLPTEKTQVITPSIDPFSVKNSFLPPTQGTELLAGCGIDTARPLITQVSRFGTWKNPKQVIDITV